MMDTLYLVVENSDNAPKGYYGAAAVLVARDSPAVFP
jgi:hypothetical protein